MIETGALTDGVIDRLAAGAGGTWHVGDGIAPVDGGWTELQPGAGEFIPYVVLTIGTSQPLPQQTMSVSVDDTSWEAAFTLAAYAGSRAQLDWVARGVRNVVAALRGLTFGTITPYAVSGVRMPALGGVRRVDSAEPPFWTLTDTVVLLCTAR